MSVSMNTIRLSGMSSGLDTENIIKDMMKIYQSKVDKQQQETTKLEWKQDAYREVNTLIKNFRSTYLSALSSSNMMASSAYNIYSVDIKSGSSSAVSISASSSASEGSLTINSVQQLAEAAVMKSTGVFTGETYSASTTLDDLELATPLEFDVNGQISFSINDKTFTFDSSTTIGDMMKEINSSDAGVTMSFSTLTKGFTIKSNTTGADSKVDIVNLTGNAFDETNSAFGISQGIDTGENAICTIEDTLVSQSSNTFSYDGITYTLNDTTDEAIEFNVSRDVDGVVNKIKTFVDAYNELISGLQSRLDEEVYRDYSPLTDSQKEEMSEDEISKWEDKAKSGTLYGDSYISKLLTTLRSAFYTQVEAAGFTPSDIGLSTGIYSDGGKITIDESTLRSAIENNPDEINDLFIDSPTGGDFEDKGLIVRISDSLLTYTKDVTSIALDSLGKSVSESEEREDSLIDIMNDKEEALWKRFSTMETALSKLNSMSSWISSLFTSTS